MLETVRQYAHAKLLVSGEGETVRNRHLDNFLYFAQQAGAHLRGQAEMTWLDRVEEELPNLRMAIEWSLNDRVIDGMELASSLFWFWHIRNISQEPIGWHEKLLKAEEALLSPDKTQVDSDFFVARRLARARLLQIAFTLFVHNRTDPAKKVRSWLNESIAICRQLGSIAKPDLAFSLRCLPTSRRSTRSTSWSTGW